MLLRPFNGMGINYEHFCSYSHPFLQTHLRKPSPDRNEKAVLCNRRIINDSYQPAFSDTVLVRRELNCHCTVI